MMRCRRGGEGGEKFLMFSPHGPIEKEEHGS